MFKTMKLIEFQTVCHQQLSAYNNVTATRLKAKNSFQGYCYAEEWHPTLLWPRSPISATAELLFPQLIVFPNPQVLYNAFLLVRHPQNCPLHAIQYMFRGPNQLSIPNCISIDSTVFAQLTVESPYTVQYALKRDQRAIKKLIAAINAFLK